MSLLVVQATDDPWTEAVMKTPRNSHTLTLLSDGRVLAAGGWDGASPLASAELYDPASSAWQTVSPMSDTRAYPTATLLPDGRVLVAGGWNTLGAARASAEIYDPKTDTWRIAATMRFSRAEHTATLLPTGLVLVVGGYGDDGLQAQAELYDPVSDAWTPAGALRTGRGHHTATLLPTGQVLVVGGWDDANRPLASAELYDPAANAWTPAAELATARLDHTATLLPDGTLLAAGGYNGAYLASAEVYDPATAAWTTTGAMNVARAYHAAVLLRNGKVLVAGGADGLWPHDTAETYHPQARNWTPTGQLHKAYESHLALLLRDGKVLIAGRPDHGDRSGNGGHPTPTPTTAVQRTPQPLDWLLTPLPTATRKASNGLGVAAAAFGAADAAAAASVAVVAVTTPANYTEGTDDAALYGLHEIAFTLPAVSNPYAADYSVTFVSLIEPAKVKTVMAFYDGSQSGSDLWKARVYVNRVGTWNWTLPAGAEPSCPTGGCSFTAVEVPSSGLHGMLRVSALATTQQALTPLPRNTLWATPGAPKRWYTDDGHTFLPMADTAYRLFFAGPTVTLTPPPGTPISDPCPPIRDSAVFVHDYVQDVKDRGINVIRVEALGNWAYQDTYYYPYTSKHRSEFCEPDLSLFWSQSKDTNDPLFDGAPTIGQLAGTPTPPATPIVFYPNLASFRRTDDRLKELLNASPSLYVQLLLVPEPKTGDHTWLGVNQAYRTQLWKTMVARWAAFPNVFWSISNDLGDTNDGAGPLNDYPNNITLTDAVGNYFFANDPWFKDASGRPIRPLSMGHLRWQIDSSSGKSWHTYITAYTAADISAEEMDGPRGLPEATPRPYAATPKPVFNVEDQYEAGPYDPDHGDHTQEVWSPNYYFRRLFWSYLLSGSGATYGAYATWSANHRYSQATYTCQNPQGVQTTFSLEGLNSAQYIPYILETARTDLALFKPNDALIMTPTGDQAWAELNRAQVTSRDNKEILVYVPNRTVDQASAPDSDVRRHVAMVTSVPTVVVNMSTFTDPAYAVTWYDPKTGAALINTTATPTPIPGKNPAVILQAPSDLTGDAVVHISSRCLAPNKCLPMDEILSSDLQQDRGEFYNFEIDNFQLGVSPHATIRTDTDYSIFGNSWRGNANAPYWIEYKFPGSKSVSSAGFYFRFSDIAQGQGYVSQAQSFVIILFGSDYLFNSTENPTFVSQVHSNGNLEMDLIGIPTTESVVLYIPEVAPDLHHWYYLETRVKRTSSNQYRMQVSLDGVLMIDYQGLTPWQGDQTFNYVRVYTYNVWLDELSIDPETTEEARGLRRAFLQQGLGGYTGTTATWLDASGGYNNTNTLLVGENGLGKALLRFDLATLPTDAIVDEAILQLYYTSRSNGNSLTLGAHGMMVDWTDSQVNWPQRKTGVNWNVAGLGSGSDYTATAAATVAVPGAGGAWVDLNITNLAQSWVSDPAANLGLALTQETSSGYVYYNFCSELGWDPCTQAQAPKLTLRYHLVPPPPVKATFQRGVNGYTGNQATWLDASGGYNNTAELLVGENTLAKSLLTFDVATIPITATVDEATLRLYQTGRSNGNTLTLGAHQVLAAWIDSQANWTQRQSGVNWGVAGLGSGSDYAASANGTADLVSAGGAWVDVDVKAMTQAWVSNPTQNQGLVLTQDAASGYVIYTFCSELGWSPCSAAQAPKLTVWYH